jgi:hypothetical protein
MVTYENEIFTLRVDGHSLINPVGLLVSASAERLPPRQGQDLALITYIRSAAYGYESHDFQREPLYTGSHAPLIHCGSGT